MDDQLAPAATMTTSDHTATPDRAVKRLLASVPFASATSGLGFAVSGYFLALQVQAVDADAKVANLALVQAAGAVAAMVAQPLIGVLSDRTRTRAGARPPWILLGALIGSVGLIKIPLGSIAGAFLGAAVGAVIGLGSCLVVGPACLATAPAAIGTFAGMGGLLGTLTAGGAAVVDGVWRYLSTVNAAPGESMYAHQGGVLDPNGTGVPDAVLRMPPSLGSGSSSGSGS